MLITGTTRVYYCIGDPVAQVRAPELYNHLFQRHGVDAVMVPMKIAPSALVHFIDHIVGAENVGGFLATIPHKGVLADLLDPKDPVARVAHAVNAVKRHDDGRLEPALFDGSGFVRGLDHFGIGVEGRRVLVVGAGGGGHAVAAALALRRPSVLAIANRTPAKAHALVERLRPWCGEAACVAAIEDAAGFDLVVNCTSQGLNPTDALPFDPTCLGRGAAVVDTIMTREPTPLLRACRDIGLRAEPGFEMLVQQVPEVVRLFGFAGMAGTLEADMREVRALLVPR